MAGIVTAVSDQTFYLETPDALQDDDLRTTEGIRVYTQKTQLPPNLVGMPLVVNARIVTYREENSTDLFACEAVDGMW